MQADLINNFEELNINSNTWNSLLNDCYVNTIFQTYEWFLSCWETFGEDSELFFIKITDNDEILGIGALMISLTENNKRLLHFVGDNASDYLDFIVNNDNPEILQMICKTIFDNKSMWDEILLKNIPSDSPNISILEGIFSSLGLPNLKTGWVQCPALLFNRSNNENTKFIQRKSLKRVFNRLSKMGELRTTDYVRVSEIDSHLDSFFDQHITRWQDTSTPSLFMDKLNKRFFKNIVRSFKNRGDILFTVISLNEKPIAYHFGFDYNNKIIWYKPSFDIHKKQYSPGLLLIRHLTKYCVKNGRSELDFTIGNEGFKKRYTNTNRANIYLSIYKNRSSYFKMRLTILIRMIVKRLLGKNRPY